MTRRPAIVVIAYDVETAAEAVSLSTDVIRRAIRSGDLATTSPKIEGRALAKPLIDPDNLRAWALNRRRAS